MITAMLYDIFINCIYLKLLTNTKHLKCSAYNYNTVCFIKRLYAIYLKCYLMNLCGQILILQFSHV